MQLSKAERKKFNALQRERLRKKQNLLDLTDFFRMNGINGMLVVAPQDLLTISSGAISPGDQQAYQQFNLTRQRAGQRMLTIDEWRKKVSAGQATPGPIWNPGTPGVATPPVDPFHTPDENIDSANAQRDYELALQDIDNNLFNMSHEGKFQKQAADKAAKENAAAANDAAIARGLFQSSIRDAELADITATNALRKRYLDDQLAIADTQALGRKKTLQSNFESFLSAMRQKAAQNAAEVGANQPPWEVEPTEGQWIAPTPPGAPGAAPGAAPPPGSMLNPPPPGTDPAAVAAAYAAAGREPTGTGSRQQSVSGSRRRGRRR